MDIIITGKRGSGKSAFAQEFLSETHVIYEEKSVEDIKRICSSRSERAAYEKNVCFITQDVVDTSLGNRRFVIINMPDNG